MRTLTITRRPGLLGEPVDTKILADEKPIGNLSASEESVTLPISKGQHAIQCQIVGPDGKTYRSNAYFAIGSKSVKLHFTTSGTRLILEID